MFSIYLLSNIFCNELFRSSHTIQFSLFDKDRLQPVYSKFRVIARIILSNAHLIFLFKYILYNSIRVYTQNKKIHEKYVCTYIQRQHNLTMYFTFLKFRLMTFQSLYSHFRGKCVCKCQSNSINRKSAHWSPLDFVLDSPTRAQS